MLMTDTLVRLCHSCTQHFQTLSAQLDSLVKINKGTLSEQVVIGIIDPNHTVEIENHQVDFQFELDAAISSIISE